MNLITRSKKKNRKGRRSKFCWTVHLSVQWSIRSRFIVFNLQIKTNYQNNLYSNVRWCLGYDWIRRRRILLFTIFVDLAINSFLYFGTCYIKGNSHSSFISLKLFYARRSLSWQQEVIIYAFEFSYLKKSL